ncbi:MAG: ATP-binding protein [Actinomycetes bacterium]
MAPPPSVISADAPTASHATRVLAPVRAVPRTASAGSLRLVFVVGLAITGSLWRHPTDAQTAIFYVWGLVWLPLSILLLFASGGARRRLAGICGLIGDTVFLLASLAVFPDVPGLFLIGLLLALLAGWQAWPGLSRWGSAALVVGAATCVRFATADWGRAAASSVAFAAITAITTAIWLRMERISNRAETLTSSLRSRAETVLARVPHPLVISGPKGRIVNCNPATLEVIGDFDLSAPCCEALGLRYGERRLECTHGCALLELCRDTEDGYVEVWRLREDGSRQPLLASAAEIPDAHGRVVEVVHSLRDISRLKAADEAKTIFLATASHELKTPLTVINGYAQLLLRDEANPHLRRQGLEAIAGRARELAEIVERLLLSSRIESGRLSVTLAPLDLAAIVRERVEALATATDHTINVTIQDGLPPVNADAMAMATVLDHLIDNAIKYSPDDASLDVVIEGGDSWVTLRVCDQGVGMGEEQRRRCFDKFWQAESGDRRPHGGTGLGLYIVKSLVDSMGGRITVDSEPGVGTHFSITLATPGGQLPGPRSPQKSEPSMIR